MLLLKIDSNDVISFVFSFNFKFISMVHGKDGVDVKPKSSSRRQVIESFVELAKGRECHVSISKFPFELFPKCVFLIDGCNFEIAANQNEFMWMQYFQGQKHDGHL